MRPSLPPLSCTTTKIRSPAGCPAPYAADSSKNPGARGASETSPAPYTNIPPAELRPAPMPGQHTREICHKVLALDTEEIDRLIAKEVLFTGHRRPS